MNELEIPNSLDMELFTKHVVGAINDLKAKDIFTIIELHEKAIAFLREAGLGDDLPREVQGVYTTIKQWLVSNFSKLMPQEVVIALYMQRSEELMVPAQRYLIGQLNHMELSETTQVFYSLLNKHLQREKALQKVRTTDADKQAFEKFLAQVVPHFEGHLDRLDDKSLAFLLSA